MAPFSASPAPEVEWCEGHSAVALDDVLGVPDATALRLPAGPNRGILMVGRAQSALARRGRAERLRIERQPEDPSSIGAFELENPT
jgi:hypothetical protein